MELLKINQLSKEIIKELKSSTRIDMGLKILHMFIMDILGRNTPAAKIFGCKSEEE